MSHHDRTNIDDFLDRLHDLRTERHGEQISTFCVDWLINEVNLSRRTKEPLHPGISALVDREAFAATNHDVGNRVMAILLRRLSPERDEPMDMLPYGNLLRSDRRI